MLVLAGFGGAEGVWCVVVRCVRGFSVLVGRAGVWAERAAAGDAIGGVAEWRALIGRGKKKPAALGCRAAGVEKGGGHGVESLCVPHGWWAALFAKSVGGSSARLAGGGFLTSRWVAVPHGGRGGQKKSQPRARARHGRRRAARRLAGGGGGARLEGGGGEVAWRERQTQICRTKA